MKYKSDTGHHQKEVKSMAYEGITFCMDNRKDPLSAHSFTTNGNDVGRSTFFYSKAEVDAFIGLLQKCCDEAFDAANGGAV